MISRFELDQRVREWGLREEVVEKDYVLGWVLWGIGSDEVLSTAWAFKGGTCLKKCYLETFRFSEDLDFGVLPGGPIRSEEVEPRLLRVLQAVHEKSGVIFDGQPPRLKTHDSGNYTECRIYYRGPRRAFKVASVRVDLLSTERVIRQTVLRPIAHAYSDQLPPPAMVRCYGLEEVFAEKLRAMGERSRPRDLYDIVHLFRRRDLRQHARLVREVLAEKCTHKGIPVPSLDSIAASPKRPRVASGSPLALGSGHIPRVHFLAASNHLCGIRSSSSKRGRARRPKPTPRP